MGGCCTVKHKDPHYTLNTIFGTTSSKKRSLFEGPQTAMSKRGTIALHIANMVQRKENEIHKEYKFNDVLGKGAYGEVRKGVHRITGVVRAIKTVSKVEMNSEQKLRLINEVEILKNLDHPNIIKVYEFYEDETNFYIVTEMCTGGELFDRIMEKSCMDEEESANIMRQILSAVVYFHSKFIVHRDLKPENVLYESKNSNSTLKIIDFGTSRAFTKNEELKNTYGTVYYIAPEVIKGKYNEKCDIWSCGVILYVLLCGYPPFGGSNDKDIMARIKSGPVKYDSMEWEEVSLDAKDLLKKMMDYNVQARYTASQAMEHIFLKNSANNKISNTNKAKVLSNLKNFRVNFNLFRVKRN